MIAETTETAITELNGTFWRLTRRKIVHPGIARSRENAYQVREALVRPAAPQNSWPTVAMMKTSFAAHESSASVKIAPTKPAASVTTAASGTANRKLQQQGPADDRRVEHRAPHALGRCDRGAPGLLGRMRRGVVAGLGVHRQQEADGQHQHPEAERRRRAPEGSVVVDALGEDEAQVLVAVRNEDQQPDHDRDAEQVPADRDVVHQLDEPIGEDVDDRVADQDQGEQDPGLSQDVLGVGEVHAEDVDL